MNSMSWRSALLIGATIALAAGQPAVAGSVTVQDTYWGAIGAPGGGIDPATTTYGDVIGPASDFNIMSAKVSRSGDDLTITINTNYNAADFDLTQFGDLFLTEGADWLPNGTAANNYDTDDLSTTGTKWLYGVQATGLNSDASAGSGVVPPQSGNATAYSLNNSEMITSYVPAGGCAGDTYGNPYDPNCGYIWRYDQPVQINTATASPDFAGDGTWSFTQDADGTSYDLSYTFDAEALDPNLLVGADGFDVGFSWAMTCSNDIIQGVAYVPEPSSLVLMTTGLVGILSRRRKLRLRRG